MADAELRARAEEEQNRITRILNDAGISERRMQTLAPIIENVSWMRAKLDDSRSLIKNSNIVVPYDNGGGQKGIRENPAFKGYEALWKAYMQGMNRILDTLPPEVAQEATEAEIRPVTVLDTIRGKHNKL
jgi:hypothetical protein